MKRYATTAQVLRMLVGSNEPVIQSGRNDDPVKHALRLAVEACEGVDRAEAERDQAAIYAAELCLLLEQAAEVLDAQPSPSEGGAWKVYMLSRIVRQALDSPTPASVCGRLLLDELLAARDGMRAADALMAAVQDGDPDRIRESMDAFEDAAKTYRVAAVTRRRVAREESSEQGDCT